MGQTDARIPLSQNALMRRNLYELSALPLDPAEGSAPRPPIARVLGLELRLGLAESSYSSWRSNSRAEFPPPFQYFANCSLSQKVVKIERNREILGISHVIFGRPT